MKNVYDPSKIVSSHCDAIILGPGYESMMVSVYFGFVIYVGRGGIQDLTPYQALSKVSVGNQDINRLVFLHYFILQQKCYVCCCGIKVYDNSL